MPPDVFPTTSGSVCGCGKGATDIAGFVEFHALDCPASPLAAHLPEGVDSADHKAGPRRANVRAHGTQELRS